MRLAALIRDRWPPVRVIITSGHTKPPQAACRRTWCSSRNRIARTR
nr:hypothetical protein [Rhizobium wenxiniae]